MDPLTLALFAIFQVKHFIADFPLQSTYMLGKQADDWSFVRPLAAHASVHALATLLIVLAVRPELWWLALVDFLVHFLVDRFKAGARYLGRYRDPSEKAFWNALGFDQMLHHLTHLGIIWALVAP